MTAAQIIFYESLEPDEQYLLNILAIRMLPSSLSDMTQLLEKLKYESQKKLTQVKIKEIFLKAIGNKIIEPNSNNHFPYKPSFDFSIYVFPLINYNSEQWHHILNSRNWHVNNIDQIYLRNYLYCLLYDKKNYLNAEESLLKYVDRDKIFETLNKIAEIPAYEAHFSVMSDSFYNALCENKIDALFYKLTPLSIVSTEIEKLKNTKVVSLLEVCEALCSLEKGDVTKVKIISKDTIEFEAIEKLLLDDADAIPVFLKMMKLQQQRSKIPQFPLIRIVSFYYMLALAMMDPEKSTVIINKMIKVMEKSNSLKVENIFLPVLYNMTNQSDLRDRNLIYLDSTILLNSNEYDTLICISLCFLADHIPSKVMMPTIYRTIVKAIDGEYFLLALEAAFAYQSWMKNADGNELLALAQKQCSHTPVLSRLSKTEDWEKTLNALLSLNLGKKAGTSTVAKGSRVVYFVDFGRSNNIQPVLQTAQKNGWSKGRNIALKSFSAGTTSDMTEQDYRIAKTIKRYNSYYGADEYEFSENAIKELVGHPYLFLATGQDISVELIEEKPVIQVTKTTKGYSLSSNIDKVSDDIIIQKETNTRYKIYNLTASQKQVIEMIAKQKIVVPESGKDKLMKLLAGFSTQMEVHSDLLSNTKDKNSTVKDIAPDSKIRVQLLPLGSGLKAELFSKPFGTTPPYCKPGKGGLVLLANEKGTQLQVKRNLKLETQYADTLMDDIQAIESLSISDGLLSFENEMDTLDLLDKLQIHQDICVIEWPEGVRLKLKGTADFKNLSLKVKANNNWFDLQGELKIDEKTVLTIQELLALSEKGHNRFIELSTGEFLALSKELKKHLDELQAFSTNSKNGLQINKFASVAMGDFFDSVKDLKTDKHWKEFRANITHEENQSVAIPSTLQAELRPYQEEGFRWMNQLAQWGAGACLADDMGLGKTIQTLTLLLQRAALGPALVIAPVSVIGNWVKEAARFAPTLNIKTLDLNNRAQIIEGLEAGDVLISSYGLLQSEEKLFVKQTYATLVLDEAHTIKNYATKTSKSTMLLNASFKVALTGTPLQNHLGEIWNLFNFINPGLLGNLESFRDRFVKSSDENSSKQLKKLITPFILRRTKSVVLDELPSKTEIIKKIELSTKERAFYEALRRKALENIASDDTAQGNKQFKVMAEITKLRQASCNPLLVDATTDISSSKLEAFLEITEELIENKHKALVFSQFVTHLAIMRKALDEKGIKYQYLDGSTPIAKREEAVKKFQAGEGDLFLISLKAGGLGLNLTAADYVIHLDPWWNPAIEDQASDRAHRMGQLRPVTIYRLVAENTIEEKIIQLHNTKRNLAESLLEGSDQSAQMSINELINLIKGD